MKTTNKLLPAMLAFTLIFALAFTACDLFTDSGHTFEFTIQNGFWDPQLTPIRVISKVEFFNGANENSRIIHTETLNLTNGQHSNSFRVSGFTEVALREENRIVGIRATLDDDRTVFGHVNAPNNTRFDVRIAQGLGRLDMSIWQR